MRTYVRALAIAGAMVAVIVPSAHADTTTQDTLTVQGTGETFVTPDVADLSVSVQRTRPTSGAALSVTSHVTDAVVGATRALGIPASDIQTSEVNVTRETKHVGPHKQRVVHFIASESLTIHVTDIALLGKLVAGVNGAGASSIDGPSYSFSDPDAGIEAANDAAIADARRQADNAAAAVGDVVTGVQSIDLDPGEDGVSDGTTTAASAPASAPVARAKSHQPKLNLHPGRQEVDATVEIVYTIAPAPSS